MAADKDSPRGRVGQGLGPEPLPTNREIKVTVHPNAPEICLVLYFLIT